MRRLLLVVFAVGLAMRLIYTWEIRDLPTQHKLVMDAERYDQMARQIREGGWRPRQAFYQAPLYPYLLATIYAASGSSLVAVRLLQCLAGALAAVLIAVAAGRLADADDEKRRRALAVTAGLLAALYAPAVFYAPLLLKPALVLFLEAAALVLLLPPGGGPLGARRGLAAGCVLGLAALVQETLLSLVPAAAAFVWVAGARASARLPLDEHLDRSRSGWRETPQGRHAALAILVGGALALVPAAGLNLAAGAAGSIGGAAGVGDGTVMISSNSGMNFYIGNGRGATGTYRPLSGGSQTPDQQEIDAAELAAQLADQGGRPVAPASLSRAAVSQIFWHQALAEIAADPASWGRLMLRKARLFWNAYEIPDAEGLRVYRQAAPVLRFDPVFFGLLAPLSAVGLMALLRRDEGGGRRGGLLLAALSLATCGAVILFFIFGRFRLPVVVFLTPLAAAGILELADLAAAGQRPAAGNGSRQATAERLRRAGLDLALLATVGLAVNLPCWPAAEISRQDAVIEYNLGSAALRWADDDTATGGAAALGRRLERTALAAGYLSAASLDSPGFFAADLAWATALARHGSTLAAAGQPAAALADFAEARQRLIAATAVAGREQDRLLDREARSLLAALDQSAAATLTNVGLALMQSGHFDRAEAALTQAAALAPGQPGPEGGLALCWLERGRAARRAGALREARDLLRSSAQAYHRAARAAATQGRADLEAVYRQGLAAAEAELTAARQPTAAAR